METINTMAKAAATAVWGEQKPASHQEEPISGQMGDTSKGEPFDKGNEEHLSDETNHNNNYTTTTTSSTGGAAAAGEESSSSSSAAFAKNSGLAAESDNVPRNPSSDLKAQQTPQDSTKGQNDVRAPEDPATHPRNAPTDIDDTKKSTTTDEKDDGMAEAQKLDGPGPAPLEEVARKHGGDAGKSNSSVDKAADSAAAGDKAADAEDEDEDGPNAKSKGEGTGEQYVKSTGLAADGGDFDATKPGAGREADRLLEEKGVTREVSANKSHDSPTESPDKSTKSPESSKTDVSTEKKSLKDKIKDKLHRH